MEPRLTSSFEDRILSQVQDAVVVTNTEDEIVLWNAAAERLYGLPVRDAMGRKLAETVLSNWIQPDHLAAVEVAVRQRGHWEGTALQKHADGREMHVEMTIGVLRDDKGESLGRMTVARDITEKKQVESRLIHSEKLVAMGQLAAGVAHELKAPVGVIYSHADVLLEKGGVSPEVRKTLEIIKAHARREVDLIDHLLEFSRRETLPDREVFDVQDALSFPLSLVSSKALRNNVSVRGDFHPSPMKVLGHKDMFEQVIINLSLNAIDAMPAGGTLTLRSRRGALNGRPAARIEVSDTGPGIPTEVQKDMFEPFFTTKEKGKGTGLGLWMARQIVTALEGDLRCRSEAGKGTTFEFQVPLAAPTEERGNPEATAAGRT